MKQPQAKTHPFYITWKQVKYQGLTSTSIWTKILQVLRITNKSEYVKFNQQCSAVYHTINNKIEPVNTQFTQINDKISNNFESGTLKVTQQVNKHL